MMTQWRRSTTSMAVAVRSVAQYLRTTSSARRASPQVLGSLTSQYQQENGMRVNYSTTTTSSVPPPPPPSDPDTHDDFKPTNKSQSSGLSSLKELVEQDVKENPVMIYMKGVPDFPQCGFSSLAVKVLKHHNAPLSARNILEDPELKNAVKAYSLWPTFPQVFIKGEFIGGSDIVLNMHQSGELKEKLKDLVAAPASAKSE